MKNIIRNTGLTLLLALLLNVSCVSAQAESIFKVQAFGIDSIAGYPAHIYSSRTLADKNVIFKVTKPDGTELSIPVMSDSSGVAEFDLYDFHTQKAGNYSVTAKLEEGVFSDPYKFKIYSDEVSDYDSKAEASKLVATADSIDKIYITVTLTDKFNNPVKDHSIEVISSRPEDKIQKVSSNSFTDNEGKMIFSASSAKKGVSIYSFLDTTNNIVLTKRLEVAYTSLQNAGGFIETAYAQEGVVSELSFANLSANILPNSDVPFTLSALDTEDGVVPNYSGTVHFSAEGSNSVYAKLPNDYSFDVDMDSGIKQFSGPNSLNFSQPGVYTVVATDLTDFTIRGTTEILVGTSGSQTTTPPTSTYSTSETIITAPTAGIYGDKQLSISGTAPTGAETVQVFDNDINIGTTNVEDNMTFTYQPSLLQDGQHKVFAVALDNEGSIIHTSEEVNFTIDSSPPIVENIKFTPSKGIKTGDVIDIVVTSDTPVAQGAVVFNIDIAELEPDPDDSKRYLASIQAPLEAGTYPIDVILVDDLGNEGSYEDVATVEVSESGSASVTGTTTEPEEKPPVDEYPGDVFGVTSAPSDQKVTLTWQPATDDKGIKNYKIYYGLSAANLNMTVETKDNTTTWYIPNLQNGSEYFFAVAAIDTKAQESENKSSLVSGIPFSSEPILYIPAEEPVEVKPTAPTMQATGPEMIWFVLASIFISKLYFKKKSKVC